MPLIGIGFGSITKVGGSGGQPTASSPQGKTGFGGFIKSVGGFLGDVISGKKSIDLSGIKLPTVKTEVVATKETKSFLGNIGIIVGIIVLGLLLLFVLVRNK